MPPTRALPLVLALGSGCAAYDLGEASAPEMPAPEPVVELTNELDGLDEPQYTNGEIVWLGRTCPGSCYRNPAYRKMLEARYPDDLCGIGETSGESVLEARWFVEDDAKDPLRPGTFTALIDGGRYHFPMDEPPVRETIVERCLGRCRAADTAVRFTQPGCAFKMTRARR